MMRKFFVGLLTVTLAAVCALAQSQQAPTLRIVTEDGNRLPAELVYGNTKVKPLRLRPGTNTPITIDDADFFVQQHYIDFLSRFPDQGGFAFWQNEILSCGANAACIDLKRQNVSAAFFLSIEFQETGFLVYRAYKAAFGDINPPTVPVPVRREQFMPETRSILNGVIVGVGNWAQQLEANKAAYALAFVNRADFKAAYPDGMTPAAFVDKLNQNAGGALDAGERQTLINDLTANNTAAGRASALRRVADDQTLRDAEFNRAFVLMQYFGYLKRNPNDPPDVNYGGWSFWLDKLNDNNGNFVQAEMVKAFITSIEYRGRF